MTTDKIVAKALNEIKAKNDAIATDQTESMAQDEEREHNTHTAGYHVWLYGERYWHQSFDRAVDRVLAARAWCNHGHVIEVATGKKVY